jgi:tetratricopeptide (TPR) repeat protein
MHKITLLTRMILIAALPGCLSVGCTKEAKRSRTFNSAERDFKEGAFDKAKIEYLSALRLGSQNPAVYARLGQIWFAQGVPLKAGAFLIKARELAPNDLENRLRLAQVYSAVGSRGEAQKEASFVLQHASTNGEALLLLTEMAQSPAEISAAEQAVKAFPEKESVGYYLAGANLAMRKTALDEARQQIDRALAKDPKSAEAHHSRAVLFLLQKDVKGAGQEFKAAAELSPPRSSLKIIYAEYLTRSGSNAEATAYLRNLTKNTPDLLPAWSLLARAALAEKKHDEALSLLENVFSRDPENVDARLLQASALLAKQQTKKAVDILESLDRSHPGAPGIKFELARAYLQDARPVQASDALNKAITANPNYADAILLKAKIDLRFGRPAEAVSALEGLLKKQANLVRAQTLLADAYRALGRLDDAASVFRQQIEQSPNNSEAHTFLGLIQQQQGKPEDARRSFEKSLELAPQNLLALSKMIDLDLLAKNFDGAQQRVEQQMRKEPNSGSSYLLKGKVLTAKKDWPAAEAALKKAIELDPGVASAYDLLVGIYLETGKSEDAIQELEGVLAKSPQNKAALETLASIHEKRAEFEKAGAAYERLLAIDPNSVTALNNLAYISAERLNQPDKGLELARKARTLASANPAVADTLGWIFFKRGDYQQAAALLEEAAAKITDSPEVRFHLGMAHYMMGLEAAAKSDFEQALSMPGEFASKQEAERRLQLLNQTAGGAGTLTAEQLGKMLQEHPNDLIVRLRLAEVYKTQNAFDRAAAAYEEAFRVNPKLASVALELAQLYSGPLKSPKKALQFAKDARNLAPADPQTAGILGRIAYDSGNFLWAYSLLQESARQSEGDPKALHDLAWAAYSLGKIDPARQAMQQAVGSSPTPEIAADGGSFLLMTGALDDPSALAAVKQKVEQKLQSDPSYVPALMAAAAMEFSGGEVAEAAARYRRVLQQFPDFSPAQVQLARLYSKDPSHLGEAYDWAVRARKSLPSDPEVARLLGQLSFEKKEYSRALQLLQESAQKNPLDAEGLYYLGRSFLETKQPSQARKALENALAAGLPASLIAETQRILAELKKP